MRIITLRCGSFSEVLGVTSVSPESVVKAFAAKVGAADKIEIKDTEDGQKWFELESGRQFPFRFYLSDGEEVELAILSDKFARAKERLGKE